MCRADYRPKGSKLINYKYIFKKLIIPYKCAAYIVEAVN